MGRDPGGLIQRGVGVLFEAGALGDLGDGALLGRFASERDDAAEAAFAALVGRHGGMVLRTCRAVVRDEHEAHDAFQATFLVLAREARRLWVRDSVGPWLHGVAWRVASRARAAGARRRRHERRAAEMASRTGPVGPGDRRDDEEALHEEIRRLPDRFREAVILCDLEGMTTDQASARLGTPVGTVRSRLARGRGRLRAGLIRRGLAPAIVAAGATSSGAGVVPPALADATIHAALACARAGAVPAGLAILIEGGRHAMTFKGLATLGIAAGLVAGAGALASQRPEGGKPVEATKAVAEAGIDPAPEPAESDRDELRGTWTVSRVTVNGKESDDSKYILGRLTFKSDQLHLKIIGGADNGHEQLNYGVATGARPKALRVADQAADGYAVWWIYERRGTRLRIAFDQNRPAAVRPKGFDQEMTGVHALVVLELDRLPDLPGPLPYEDGAGPELSGPPPEDMRVPAKAEDPATDKERLLGRWTILTSTLSGKEIADADLVFGTVEFRDQEVEIAAKTAKEKFRYRIDPDAEPKAIRVVQVEPANSKGKVKPLWWIYAFEKGRLKLGIAESLERPKGFDKADPDASLVVLELVRDDAPAPQAAKERTATTPTDFADADLQRLQGTWDKVAEEMGGEEYPIEQDRLVIGGNTMVTIPKGGQEEKVAAETFTIDPSREPRRMVIVRKSPPESSPKTLTGIYRVEGSTLTLAFDPTGAAVPAEFDTKAGSKQRTTVFRRRKPMRQAPATPSASTPKEIPKR